MRGRKHTGPRFEVYPCPHYAGRHVIRDTQTGALAGEFNPWRSAGAAQISADAMNRAYAGIVSVRYGVPGSVVD